MDGTMPIDLEIELEGETYAVEGTVELVEDTSFHDYGCYAQSVSLDRVFAQGDLLPRDRVPAKLPAHVLLRIDNCESTQTWFFENIVGCA